MPGNRLDEAITKFMNVFNEYDLLINEIKPDGRIHRCKAIGDTRSEKSGAYFIKPDYPYNYYVNNFRQSISYKGNFKSLKDLNYKRTEKSIIRSANQNSANDDLHLRKKAYYAEKLFHVGFTDFEKLPKQDYLFRKKIIPIGIRYDKNSSLIIPGRDINDKIWTIQFILPDGTKRFLAKTKKQGCFHKVGWTILNTDYNLEIFIAEGYATAATVFSATNRPSVVAFDAGNMLSVGNALRKAYPLAKLVFCLDVDYAGISYGLKAAIENQGKVVLPFLSKDDLASKMNDFNDLYCLNGLEEVNYQIFLQIPKMKLILIQAYKLLNNEITIDDIDPKFHNLAEKYIYGYYISDVATKISQLTRDESQFKSLSEINETYQSYVKTALVKLLAFQYFYNKKDFQDSFLIEEILELITTIMIDQSAKKISEEIELTMRRTQISKINPRFQDAVKQRLNYYWQLR